MPFFYERMDSAWRRAELYDAGIREVLPEPPSSYAKGHIYGCIFDDRAGLRERDVIGMDQILIEIDFPHADSTFPHSGKVISDLTAAAGLSEEEVRLLVRGAAIECYGLERFGITA